MPQLVTGEQARAAVEQTGLDAGQRDAVIMMLTAATATTVLVAPAGAGKSHAMAGSPGCGPRSPAAGSSG